jgi:hypothetical protein
LESAQAGRGIATAAAAKAEETRSSRREKWARLKASVICFSFPLPTRRDRQNAILESMSKRVAFLSLPASEVCFFL